MDQNSVSNGGVWSVVAESLLAEQQLLILNRSRRRSPHLCVSDRRLPCLACVIRAEPEWTSIPASVPSRLCELVHRCLQKDPKQRLQAIGDARIAIEEVLSGKPQDVGAPRSGAASTPVWQRAVPWASGILLALVVGVGVWELHPRPEPAQVVHFSFALPAGVSILFPPFGTTGLAMSWDGTEVVFTVRHDGMSQLYLRRMDQSEVSPLKGTEGGFYPFFSSDGQWVGFFTDDKLKKISVLGGTPVTLCDAPNGRGATWTPDDSIIFAPSTASGLMRVSAAGGTPQKLTHLDSSKGETTHRWRQILPSGKAILYASGIEFNSATIAVASLKTGEMKTLPIRGGYARYLTGGYLVFERQEGLYAVPFDLQRLEVIGTPFPVLQVQATPESGIAGFAVSETGSLVYLSRVETIGKLAWVDRKGVLESLGAPERDYSAAHLSPDGKRVVVVIQDGGSYDLWLYDIPRGALTRLTFGEGDNRAPIFSPDGRRVAFLRLQEGNFAILAKPADGSGSEETLLPPQRYRSGPASWSPDGKFLAYTRVGGNGKREIWVLPLEGERKPQVLLANQFDNIALKFSPDGKYLAYASDETGRYEVYVMPFGNGSGKWQISTGGAGGAVWARDGKQLFYRTGRAVQDRLPLEGENIMSVDITAQPVFSASIPRVIVPANVTAKMSIAAGSFDVSPDGQRFLVYQQSDEAGKTAQVNVVLNWSEELRRRSASGKN